MKRKAHWDEEEESDYEGTNASENESDNEEPRIKDVLEGLSQLVSRQKASIHTYIHYFSLPSDFKSSLCS